ncbi:MAG: cobalamin biosynthesis protein CbiG [Zetaproteobacteria bacterium]|nr:cobalamin biosynthesis protein CbiG [Zetaproteobacteria bacterium]
MKKTLYNNPKTLSAPPRLRGDKIVLVAITKHGAAQAAELAPKLPQADIITSQKFKHLFTDVENTVKSYEGALRAQIPLMFQNYDQIIYFVSLGAVVRLIAPHMVSKDEDPGVLVVDDAGQYVIPVLSGHVGGANAWAEYVAGLMGATPVLTTASDVGKTIPVDILGRELGWKVECPKINITRVSAHVVNEEPIALIDERENSSMDWWTRANPLPKTIRLFEKFEDVDADKFSAILWVTKRALPEKIWDELHEKLVVYRP